MRVGSLVKHIEYEYIGVVIQQGISTSNRWLIQWLNGSTYQEDEKNLELVIF